MYTCAGPAANWGCTFLQGALRSNGVKVSKYQVQLVLKRIDPGGARRRRRRRLHRRTYRVGGPRSLYHADANESMAHVFGIWLHGMIDGYSRKILYLRVAPDKLAATVGFFFKEACQTHGYGRRTRWDMGKENVASVEEQLLHWDDVRNEKGTVLIGRSVHNTRIEGIWNMMSKTIHFWRNFFIKQMRDIRRWDDGKPILDASDPLHLWALHKV